MSIGKNLNIGGSKGKKKPSTKPKKKEEKVEVVEVAQEIEEVSLKENAESEKLQAINESAAGLTLPATDPVAAQRQEADSPMVVEGQNMLIVFPVGDEEYAIEIDDIKEVVPTPPIASIPQVPEHIKGVANVRGNVLAVIDLAKKFSSNDENEEIGKFVLVIKSEEMQVAVNVLNVPNTMIVKDSEVESPTNVITNSNVGTSHIKGIIKKDKKMIIWIDIHDVMSQMQLGDLDQV